MRYVPVIGLCGPEGGGKTSTARILEFDYGFTVVPFAKPLKAMLEALGVPPENLYGTPEQKASELTLLQGKTARAAMQTLGTEWGRLCVGENLWVTAWRSMAARAVAAGARGIVTDDMRFANEALAVKDLRGMRWCVVRSPEDFKRVPKHASEDFASVPRDDVIYNDGTLDQLAERIHSRLDFAPRLVAAE